MSIKVMTLVWGSEAVRDERKLLVLLALADWANDAGECWPSMSALARKARQSERGTRYILQELRDVDRMVSWDENKGGRKKTNKYQITLHSLQGLACEKPVNNPKKTVHSVQGIKPKPCTEGPETLHSGAENPAMLYCGAGTGTVIEPSRPRTVKSGGAEKASAPRHPEAEVKSEKQKPDPRVAEVIRHFSEQCQKPRVEGGQGFKPVIAGKRDGGAVQVALKSLSLDECNRAVDFFLCSSKADEIGITLTIALSTHSINLWRQTQGALDKAFDSLVDVLGRIDMGEQGVMLSHEQARKAAFAIGWEKVLGIYQRAGPLGLRPVFEQEFSKLGG